MKKFLPFFLIFTAVCAAAQPGNNRRGGDTLSSQPQDRRPVSFERQPAARSGGEEGVSRRGDNGPAALLPRPARPPEPEKESDNNKVRDERGHRPDRPAERPPQPPQPPPQNPPPANNPNPPHKPGDNPQKPHRPGENNPPDNPNRPPHRPDNPPEKPKPPVVVPPPPQPYYPPSAGARRYYPKRIYPVYAITETTVYVINSYPPDTSDNYKNWGFDRVNAAAAHARGVDGSGVVIMVIDGGVSSHGEFKPGGIQTLDFTGTGPGDNKGHGTSVIGVILSQGKDAKGVAPGAKIYSAKADAGDGGLSVPLVIKAIDWAIENNKRSAEKVSIINISYGLKSWDGGMADAVKRAYAAGILVVAPTGNYGYNRVLFPANMEEVIGVSAISPGDVFYENSSYGAGVDFIAPGSEIYTTALNGGYGWPHGTSMAAPYVSGLAALAVQSYRLKNGGRSPSPAQLKQILCGAARPAPYLVTSQQGCGLIDAAALI